MNIQTKFENKDLIKNLGCLWDKDTKQWYSPLWNTDANFEKLIALQDEGKLAFIDKLISRKIITTLTDKKIYDLGYKFEQVILCMDKELIYQKINNYKTN
jgi:hypothetical protein